MQMLSVLLIKFSIPSFTLRQTLDNLLILLVVVSSLEVMLLWKNVTKLSSSMSRMDFRAAVVWIRFSFETYSNRVLLFSH